MSRVDVPFYVRTAQSRSAGRPLLPVLQRAEPVAWVLMASLIVGCMAVMYLSTRSQAATITYSIQRLDDEQTQLQQQESDLRVQADQLESLQRIHDAALRLGMSEVKPGEVTYLQVPAVHPAATVVPGAMAQSSQP